MNISAKQDLVEIYNELAVNTDNWNGYYLQNYWQKRQEEPALSKAEDTFIKNPQGEMFRGLSSCES